MVKDGKDWHGLPTTKLKHCKRRPLKLTTNNKVIKTYDK